MLCSFWFFSNIILPFFTLFCAKLRHSFCLLFVSVLRLRSGCNQCIYFFNMIFRALFCTLSKSSIFCSVRLACQTIELCSRMLLRYAIYIWISDLPLVLYIMTIYAGVSFLHLPFLQDLRYCCPISSLLVLLFLVIFVPGPLLLFRC